ncbi:hypothetical protein HDV00_008292 [Rhizophlyctis rosea]|nr:hypothetical protein HDV00_008292 [Rhizophlyctis rosea]
MPPKSTIPAKKIIPIFTSTSIPNTVKFYTTHLHFVLGGLHPSPDAPTFASFWMGTHADANIYFFLSDPTKPDASKKGPASCMIMFNSIDSLNAFYGGLVADKEVKVIDEIADKDWGCRQFEVEDGDGNTIMFFAFLDDGEEDDASHEV